MISSKVRIWVAGAALAGSLPWAQADVLTFDDLAASIPTYFTANYRGFQFGTNLLSTSGWFYTNAPDPDFKPHSGTNYISTQPVLNTAFEDSQAITNSTAFLFSGAWFSGDRDPIRYKLYSGANLVYTSAITTVTSTSSFFASGYNGLVTGVVISGGQGNFALDDFTYSFTTPVPEPATAGLLLLGLGALGWAARRRRRVD